MSHNTHVTGLITDQYFVYLISATSNCPDDWFRIGCSCFVVNKSTKGLTWDAAKKQCSNKRINKDSVVTLAGINSLEENDILGRRLNSGENWIGVHAEVNSSLRLPNEQNATFLLSQVTKIPLNRTCIAIQPTNIWRAGSCDGNHRYICQRTGNLGHFQYSLPYFEYNLPRFKTKILRVN